MKKAYVDESGHDFILDGLELDVGADVDGVGAEDWEGECLGGVLYEGEAGVDGTGVVVRLVGGHDQLVAANVFLDLR